LRLAHRPGHDAPAVHPPGVPRPGRPAGPGADPALRMAVQFRRPPPIELPDSHPRDAPEAAHHRPAALGDGAGQPPVWTRSLANFLALCGAVNDVVRSRPELRPDLVVSHCGLGPSLFLRDVLTCPFVHYFEYYLGRPHRDLTYRVDLPAAP